MKITFSPSHTAVLVPSAQKAAEYLRKFNFHIGELEEFEETLEIYVEGAERHSLLLMEAKANGSYQRALKKRGPGIHHFAIDVLNLENFIDSLSGSGWLLQLNSLKTFKNFKTVYLARPGFPGLIEVQEKKKLTEGPLFVEEISLPFDIKLMNLVKSIGLEDIIKASTGNSSFVLRGNKVDLKNLF